ncbi:zinc finger, PHD-type containing protein [Tanacetum coccineum]
MEVLPHGHPLKLIDLNPKYPHDEVVYDDEEELIMKLAFRCPCGRCGQEINFYHRYYYTCEQCDYSLHKLCAELPTTLKHESHRDHTLILYQVSEDKLYDDIPDLVHLPFPDETHMLKHFYGESGSRPFETNLTHPFHEHPLILVDTPCCNNDITTTLTSSRITTSSSHDSMKMVEVLCNACIRRITNMPFYKCTVEYDKHPMTLRYFPVENYNGDYFCEVCEEEFNPNGAFYHCDQCVQSMHPACCVSILQKEPIPFYPDRDYDDEFKFGKIKMVKRHPHPLSFLPWNFEGENRNGLKLAHLQNDTHVGRFWNDL